MNTQLKQKKLRSQADRLFFLVCMAKNIDGKCLLCGKVAEQIHHFKPKGAYGHLRYCIENGIPLCKSCHFILTHKDSSLQAKIVEIKGQEWYNKIQEFAKQSPTSFVNIKWYEDNIIMLKEAWKTV